MPKYKIRRAGDDIRISKGKSACEINFEILEQCVDEGKQLCSGYENELQVQDHLGEVCPIVETRSFDEIILEAFDEFNSKSSRIRSNTLTTICTQLQQTHNPQFLAKHFDRLINVIENALQSNVPCEIDAAAHLITLAAIQLPDRSMEIFYKPLRSALDNDSLQSSVRSDVCHAIAMLTFLYERDSGKIAKLMTEFRDIFIPNRYYQSYSETNKRANYEFKVAAFETWMFLMTLLPPRLERASTFSLRSAEDIFTLLDLNSMWYSMRVACAKAVAVIFECGLDDDKEYLERHVTKIIPKVSDIIGVWNKNSSDFKSTPEVLRYLQNGTPPCTEIRYGKCVLKLDSWALNVRYEMLCNVFGSANVASHLSKNEKLLTKLKTLPKDGYKFSPEPLSNVEDTVNVPPQEFVSVSTHEEAYDLSKISKNVQFATNKSPIERVKALEEICKELQQNVVPHAFFEDQKNLIVDIVCKGMKRGNDAEQLAIVRLATLTVLHLGRDERFCNEISKLFSNSLRQASASYSVNASICTALAFFELVDKENVDNVPFEPVMHLLRQIFSGSHSHYNTLNKGSSNEESSKESWNVLRVKAVEAWGLLVTLCSPKTVCSLVNSQTIKDLTAMLRTSNVELRVVSSQIVSLIIEKGRMFNNNFLKSDVPDICNVVKDLINDRSNINRDKRKTQNIKLREVLAYLENGNNPSLTVRFGDEVHELKTWCVIFKYQKLSQFIGQNLAAHLSQNERIRGIVAIGSKPVPQPFQLKPNMQYKLSSAAKKKSKTRENRLNGRTPKFGYV